MPDTSSHRIAIVGSGPSGFYALDGLLRALPGVRIDLFDRLPTPYGLVRAGVAPDHQGTKAVSRQFERLALKEGVRFLGGVELGRDLALDELQARYDSVVLAIGAVEDRRLGIPGEELPGVYGSWRFVGWYNGHPDCGELEPLLDGPGVAVIGNGNVAIDLVRVLAKTPEEMAKSDLCPAAAARIAAAAGLRDLHMIGRRGPVEASFTPAELGELGHLSRAVPVVEGVAGEIPASSGAADPLIAKSKDKNLEILRGFQANTPGTKPVTLHIRFNATPVEIVGRERVEGLVLRSPDGGTETLQVGAVITAIGYRTRPIAGLPFDAARGVVPNDQGRVADGLYVVGWARRGPSGVIATNRADSLAVVDRIAADLKQAPPRGGEPVDSLLAGRGVQPVDFTGWQRIDRAETEAGKGEGRPRRKLTRWEELIAAARG